MSRLKLSVSAWLECVMVKSSVSAWLECVMIKIVRNCMAGMFCGKNRLFQHGWNVSWSKLLISACLEDWNMSFSKFLVSAKLEFVMNKIVSFNMAGMCHGQNRQFQQFWKPGL
jgi:hypothetical protein